MMFAGWLLLDISQRTVVFEVMHMDKSASETEGGRLKASEE